MSQDQDLQIVKVVSLGASNVPTTSKTYETVKAKPLMKLITKLINSVETPILQNMQLMEVLNVEFGIVTQRLPPVEVDIYMNVLKTFLRSWSRWDEVEKRVKNARAKGDNNIPNILLEEYESLKGYIKEAIYMSTELNKKHKQQKNQLKKEEGVLEVFCTRTRLQNLFYNRPHPIQETIFNMTAEIPNRIKASKLLLAQILYWPDTKLNVNTGFLEFKRMVKMNYKHTLVNKKLVIEPEPPIIPTRVYLKGKTFKQIIIKTFPLNYLDNLIYHMSSQTPKFKYKVIIELLLMTIRMDLSHAPEAIQRGGQYVYYLNKYPYFSGFSVPLDNGDSSSSLDLELQEYISPNVTFELTKYSKPPDSAPLSLPDPQSFSIECLRCYKKYVGVADMGAMVEHYMSNHSEPDARCRRCERNFTVHDLTMNKWKHIC